MTRPHACVRVVPCECVYVQRMLASLVPVSATLSCRCTHMLMLFYVFVCNVPFCLLWNGWNKRFCRADRSPRKAADILPPLGRRETERVKRTTKMMFLKNESGFRTLVVVPNFPAATTPCVAPGAWTQLNGTGISIVGLKSFFSWIQRRRAGHYRELNL